MQYEYITGTSIQNIDSIAMVNQAIPAATEETQEIKRTEGKHRENSSLKQ